MGHENGGWMNDDQKGEMKEQAKRKEAEAHAMTVNEPPRHTGWLAVIDKMIDKGVSADLLTKVFELQARAEAEMQRKAFVIAFAAFKAEAPPSIERTGHVQFESSKGTVEYRHCELDVAAERLTPLLSKHGLAASWETAQGEGGTISVTCRLEHVDGHARTVTLRSLPDNSGSKNSVQAINSTVYYLCRYTFFAVLGIAQKGVDNDAVDERDTLLMDEQDELIDLIQRTKTDLTRFLKVAKADQIANIQRRDFGNLKAMLLRKLKKGEPA